MAGFEFKPILEPDLPEVAAFLYEQLEITSRDDWTQARPQVNDLQGYRMNPHRSPGLPMGETIRNPEGKILGMILAVPRMYRLGSQRLLGLAAGNFYVDSSARMQGFFLLRRFLGSHGVDFYYANSCNRQAGPLWAKCGGLMVLESDVEYLFPLKLGPLAEELAIRKEWHPVVAGLLRAAGPLATLVAAPRRPRNRLTLEQCVDLDRLAEIAERNRNPELLQPERSVPYLNWQYPSVSESPESKEMAHAIYRFADPSGREGWFALRFDRRGRNDQIRCARLIDVVWPFQHMAFTDVLPAMIEVAKDRSDVVSIRGRIGLGLQDRSLGLRRRTLLAPEGFLFSRTPPSIDLIKVADFPFADRY